jgi:hypothetical protein
MALWNEKFLMNSNHTLNNSKESNQQLQDLDQKNYIILEEDSN